MDYPKDPQHPHEDSINCACDNSGWISPAGTPPPYLPRVKAGAGLTIAPRLSWFNVALCTTTILLLISAGRDGPGL